MASKSIACSAFSLMGYWLRADSGSRNNCQIFAFSRTFTKADAFIGYHEDCVPAVVLQVCAELHEDGSDLSEVEREAWKEKVLSLILCHYFNYLFIHLFACCFFRFFAT